MAKGHQLRNFLVCELVIQDIGNRYTLAGVYTNDIILSEMPARLRLGLYGEFIAEAAGSHQVELLFSRDKQPLLKLTASINDIVPGVAHPLSIPGIEIGIEGPIELTISAIVDGHGRPRELVRKKIFQGPTPSGVSQQPSSHSPASVMGSTQG